MSSKCPQRDGSFEDILIHLKSCERSSSKSLLTQKNAIKRGKAELAQSLASVSISSK